MNHLIILNIIFQVNITEQLKELEIPVILLKPQSNSACDNHSKQNKQKVIVKPTINKANSKVEDSEKESIAETKNLQENSKVNNIDKGNSVHDTNNLADRNKVIKEGKEKEKLIKKKSDKVYGTFAR